MRWTTPVLSSNKNGKDFRVKTSSGRPLMSAALSRSSKPPVIRFRVSVAETEAAPAKAQMMRTGLESTPAVCNAPSQGAVMAVGDRHRIRRQTSVVRNRLAVATGIRQLIFVKDRRSRFRKELSQKDKGLSIDPVCRADPRSNPRSNDLRWGFSSLILSH